MVRNRGRRREVRPAMIEAGLLYSNRRQPGDDRKALEYFLQAANTGDRVGKYLAGECYYYGKGVPVDVPKAVGFLQEAAAIARTKSDGPARHAFSKTPSV